METTDHILEMEWLVWFWDSSIRENKNLEPFINKKNNKVMKNIVIDPNIDLSPL
jgi:hypothetical protein